GSSSTYIKLVAAPDMFFNRFLDHELAPLRVRTITSRYKNCAIIGDLSHTRLLTKLTMAGVMVWMFITQLQDEMEVAAKPEQEIGQNCPYSYAPYLSDLGLSKRSPYSAYASPGIHARIHYFGCLLGSERSMNSRTTAVSGTLFLVRNAVIMVFAYQKNVYPDAQFTRNEAQAEETGR
ncbi:unnamed protein product, partial [Ixodes hexagonus]